MTHPSYLGLQIDWPLFVKKPFNDFKQGDPFDWIKLDIPEQKVASLYSAGFIYHNKDLQVTFKIGDRLDEMNAVQMERLVRMLNDEVKKKSVTQDEFNRKKCKLSKIETKQRGLLRSFLRNNPWVQESFETSRDHILDGK